MFKRRKAELEHHIYTICSQWVDPCTVWKIVADSGKKPDGLPTGSFLKLHEHVRGTFHGERKWRVEGSSYLSSHIVNIRYPKVAACISGKGNARYTSTLKFVM